MSHLEMLAQAGTVAAHSRDARTMADLLTALESGNDFDLKRLYELPYKDFEVALGALRDWRLQRHYWRERDPLTV